jgi:hypothetical protein
MRIWNFTIHPSARLGVSRRIFSDRDNAAAFARAYGDRSRALIPARSRRALDDPLSQPMCVAVYFSCQSARSRR